MAFKDLFFTSSEEEKIEPAKVQEPTKEKKASFPITEKPVSQSFESSSNTSNEHIDGIMEVYRNGFESLNQNGVDYFEYHQSIINGGIDNSAVYSMAFTMLSAMDKTITKDKLIQQSEFYISELNKVHQEYITKGNAKRQELISQKNDENRILSSELDLFKQQMESLKIQIQDRETKLSSIDSKYSPKISEIESKLIANDASKNQIVQQIETIKLGIKNNIK